jgi:hypothetical protein
MGQTSSTLSHRHVPQSLPVVERIGGYKGTSLFQSADSETSMDDTSRISLISSSGPGSTPDDPMILFAKAIDRESERLGEPRPEAALLPPREGTMPFKPQFCGFFTVFVSSIQTKIYVSQCITEFILKMEPSYRNSLPTHREISPLGASTSTR